MPPPCGNSKTFCNVRTNPVGGWRTTPQAHDAPQISLQCSHKLKKAPPVKGASVDAKRQRRRGRQRKLFEKSFLWNPSKTFGNRCRKAGDVVGKQAGFHSLSTGFSTGFPKFRRFSVGFPQAAFLPAAARFVSFLSPGRALFKIQYSCRPPFFKNSGAV